MNIEFNGTKLEGLTVSDLDLEIRDGLHAMLEREPTEDEVLRAWAVVEKQLLELVIYGKGVV